jgi:hypothetical protein
MQKVSLDFIQPGKTTREEVNQKLASTDTGVKEDRLFLGRWASTNWGVLWGFASNNGGGGGGFNRSWSRHNVIISFDEKGVVEQYQEFPDGDLTKQLSAWVAQGHTQPLDLAVPMEIPVEHRHSAGILSSGVFLLGNDSFEFREEGREGKHSFKISPKQIHGISLTAIGHGDKADPHYIHQTLHFAEKTAVGKNMTISVNVPQLLILVKYLAETERGQRVARVSELCQPWKN